MTRQSLLVLILLFLPACLPAQPIRIGSLGLSGPLLSLWIAQDKGLFAKQELTSEFITFQGGTPTIQALLSGGIGFAARSSDTGVNAKLRGADIARRNNWSTTNRLITRISEKQIRADSSMRSTSDRWRA